MNLKAVGLDLDDCELAIWSVYDNDANSDFDKDNGDQDKTGVDTTLAPHTVWCIIDYQNRKEIARRGRSTGKKP